MLRRPRAPSTSRRPRRPAPPGWPASRARWMPLRRSGLRRATAQIPVSGSRDPSGAMRRREQRGRRQWRDTAARRRPSTRCGSAYPDRGRGRVLAGGQQAALQPRDRADPHPGAVGQGAAAWAAGARAREGAHPAGQGHALPSAHGAASRHARGDRATSDGKKIRVKRSRIERVVLEPRTVFKTRQRVAHGPRDDGQWVAGDRRRGCSGRPDG